MGTCHAGIFALFGEVKWEFFTAFFLSWGEAFCPRTGAIEMLYCGVGVLVVLGRVVVPPVCPGVDELGRGALGVPAAGCGGTPDLAL